MGFFSKHASVHWTEAESVAMHLADAIRPLDPKEFTVKADELVPEICKMHGILEELSNEQYKQIAQAATLLAYEGRQAYLGRRRKLLKNFK